MNREELEAKRVELQKQIEKLNSDLELVTNGISALEGEGFLNLLHNTVWGIEQVNFHSIVYYPSARSRREDQLQTLVCDTLKLYPHGSMFVTPLVKLLCDDGTIYLMPEPTTEMLLNYDPDKHPNQTILFDLIKEYNLQVRFDIIEDSIKCAETNLEMDKKEFAELKKKLER